MATSISVKGEARVYIDDVLHFIARANSEEKDMIAQRLKRFGSDIKVFDVKTLDDEYKVEAFAKAFKHMTAEEIEEKLGTRNLI